MQISYSLCVSHYTNCVVLTGTCVKPRQCLPSFFNNVLIVCNKALKYTLQKSGWKGEKENPLPSTDAHPQVRLHFVIPQTLKPVLAGGADPAFTLLWQPDPEPLLLLAWLLSVSSLLTQAPTRDWHILPHQCPALSAGSSSTAQAGRCPHRIFHTSSPNFGVCSTGNWPRGQAGCSLASHWQLTLAVYNLGRGHATPHHTAQKSLQVIETVLFIN